MYSAPDSRCISQTSCSLVENTSPSRKKLLPDWKRIVGDYFHIEEVSPVIHGWHTTLQTENKPLFTTIVSKTGLPVHTANRLWRWYFIITLKWNSYRLKNYVMSIDYPDQSRNTGKLLKLWVVISTTLQNRILKDIHAGHPWFTRITSLMHSYMYWPNMDRDNENLVKSCKGHTLAAKVSPIKYRPWPKTDQPSSRKNIHFVGTLYRFIFLICGAFNKFPDFFCTGIYNCRRLLNIQYVIAIHLMRWLTNFLWFHAQTSSYSRKWNTPC